ncbi:Uncharacterised protein [Vibrio cholerae]|nr:Uncharacterised protein [Vibrio cholerae]
MNRLLVIDSKFPMMSIVIKGTIAHALIWQEVPT